MVKSSRESEISKRLKFVHQYVLLKIIDVKGIRVFIQMYSYMYVLNTKINSF